MASLLASLHYLLVVLALAAAALSLVLESRVTSKLYEFFYKETPEERERGYIGDLLVQPRTTKEIRAYVLADYLLGRHSNLSERSIPQESVNVQIRYAGFNPYRNCDGHNFSTRLFIRFYQRCRRFDQSRRAWFWSSEHLLQSPLRSRRFQAHLSLSINTLHFSTIIFLSFPSRSW
jgi:hypothetical protein